ncbi:uncharacterized protein LOC106665255 isoform X3 [Cimex lectularius]|uniref:Uncharacterized protein n=1 Tax=Cimex lectularius TaxID=79782 RepID=A0A8I6TDJ9_CIMLE|nr:uncharacterized protein LOC106665255 isoform X3 [Cimex lectularius]
MNRNFYDPGPRKWAGEDPGPNRTEKPLIPTKSELQEFVENLKGRQVEGERSRHKNHMRWAESSPSRRDERKRPSEMNDQEPAEKYSRSVNLNEKMGASEINSAMRYSNMRYDPEHMRERNTRMANAEMTRNVDAYSRQSMDEGRQVMALDSPQRMATNMQQMSQTFQRSFEHLSSAQQRTMPQSMSLMGEAEYQFRDRAPMDLPLLSQRQTLYRKKSDDRLRLEQHDLAVITSEIQNNIERQWPGPTDDKPNNYFVKEKSPPVIDRSEWKKCTRIPTPPPPPSLSDYKKKEDKSSFKEKPPNETRQNKIEDKESDFISSLLHNKDVSLSSLLEAAMESTGSKRHTEDPVLKTKIVTECERKISQLYKQRLHGEGAFIPDPIPQSWSTRSQMLNHHPYLEFAFETEEKIWCCSSVELPKPKEPVAVEMDKRIESLGKLSKEMIDWDKFGKSLSELATTEDRSNAQLQSDNVTMNQSKTEYWGIYPKHINETSNARVPIEYRPFPNKHDENSKESDSNSPDDSHKSKKAKKDKRHRDRKSKKKSSRKKSKERNHSKSHDSPLKMPHSAITPVHPQIVAPASQGNLNYPVVNMLSNVPQNLYQGAYIPQPNPEYFNQNWNQPLMPNPNMGWMNPNFSNPTWNIQPNLPNPVMPPVNLNQNCTNLIPVSANAKQITPDANFGKIVQPTNTANIEINLNQTLAPLPIQNPVTNIQNPSIPGVSQPFINPFTQSTPYHVNTISEDEKLEEELKPLRKKFFKYFTPIQGATEELKKFQLNENTCASIKYRIMSGNNALRSMYTIVNDMLCRIENDGKNSKCIQVIVPKTCIYKCLVAAHNANHKLRLTELENIVEKCFFAIRDVRNDISIVLRNCKECRRPRTRSHSSERRKNELLSQRPGALVLPKIKVNLKSRQSKDKEEDLELEKSDISGKHKQLDERKNSHEHDDQQDANLSDSKKKETSDRRRSGDSFYIYRQQAKKQFNQKLYDDNEETIDLTEVQIVEETEKHSDSSKEVPSVIIEDDKDSEKKAETITEEKTNSTNEETTNDTIQPVEQDDASEKKPLDFKARVRHTQMLSDELKELINKLESGDQTVNPCYLIKGMMLCQKVNINGNSEIRIVADMDHIKSFCYIVHTMATVHAPYQKSIAMFKKHFIPIDGVEEILSKVVNSCQNCRVN